MSIRNLKRKYWYPISVSIERALRKVRIKVDKLYKKIWVYLYVLVMLPFLSAATCQVIKDYRLLSNVANLDAPFAPLYTEWRTDGACGSPPPGGDK
jgi:hypothetical protein